MSSESTPLICSDSAHVPSRQEGDLHAPQHPQAQVGPSIIACSDDCFLQVDKKVTSAGEGENPQPLSPTGTYWSGFLFVPMYMAFGILMKLQSHLRSHLFISSSTLSDTYQHHADVVAQGNTTNTTTAASRGELLENGAASESAYLFGLCVSFYYVGCFMFRLGHNVVFGGGWKGKWKATQPTTRVVIGYAGMALALGLIALLFYGGVFNSTEHGFGWTATPQAVHDHPRAVLFVSLCYWLAGCSFTTFEPNLLSTLTAHGPKSKGRSIAAQPVSTTTVAATALLGFGMAHQTSTVSQLELVVYIIGSLLCLVGIVVFQYRIPTIKFEASEDDVNKFWCTLKRWREWVFDLKWLFLAGFVDQVALACALGTGQYIYSVKKVPLLSPFVGLSSPKQVFLQHDYFLAIFFTSACVGGTLSRINVYKFKRQNPMLFLMSSALGITLILSKTPLLALVGIFCITYCNGSVYATIARTIDETVPWEFNLVAYSLVACVADIGGFTGANVVVPIHASLGSVGHGGPF